MEYHPLTSVADGGPIEFEISSTGEDYIDFANSFLHVQAKITNLDGTAVAQGASTGDLSTCGCTACSRRWTYS